MSSQSHVPAWKRVGLKLRRSDDDTLANKGPSSALSPVPRSPSKKRKLSQDSSAHLPSNINQINPAKASFSSPTPASSGVPSRNGQSDDGQQNSIQDTTAEAITASQPSRAEKKKKKRKSVTFSPDAKSEDGPVELPEGALDVDLRQYSPAKLLKREKRKQRQKRKETADGLSQDGKADVERHLTYLDEYYHHKDRWKFNKNLQTKLLQVVFDIDRLPELFNTQLHSYIAGLQGGSRERLGEDARKIREHGSSGDNSVQTGNETDMQKQRRAELILEALSSSNDEGRIHAENPKSISSKQVNSSKPRKKSRGRKRRDGLESSKFDEPPSSDDSSSS